MISNIVDEFTSMGAVVILDLHWSDDVNEQQVMPLKSKPGTGGAVEFWESVSAKFKDNDHVFYELYNEPHNNTTDLYLHGDDTYAGMLDLIAAVRNNTEDGVLVVAGGNGWAYDADSLIALDGLTSDELMMFNFHPYMGPHQAGDSKKSADGYETMVKDIVSNTNKPIISTEFGQFCCDTDGSCYDYGGTWNGVKMGYDEAVIRIS